MNETESAQTTIIGEDTDVLILLCYHANSTMHNIYYTYDVKSGTKRKKIWYINQTKESLGFALLLTFRISKLRPVLHAFCRCYTTSHIYGVGKGVLLKRAISDERFREVVSLLLEDVYH